MNVGDLALPCGCRYQVWGKTMQSRNWHLALYTPQRCIKNDDGDDEDNDDDDDFSHARSM